MPLTWKMGFEIELIAPPGVSRADLANIVAGEAGGGVERFFHPQSEPSKAAGVAVFENLSLGFRVRDRSGAAVAAFVDDVTLQDDLTKTAAPYRDWYRIVSDDARLLQLVIAHCDPRAQLNDVLGPLGQLFRTAVDHNAETGMVKVVDARNVSVAIGAMVPGERERGCEIITAPISHDHAGVLERLLAAARAADFRLPLEGATHIHFDAKPLQSVNTVANLAALLSRHGAALKQLVGTNPNCVRLGPWPDIFVEIATDPEFLELSWDEALVALRECGLTKYCDFNLLNLLAGIASKNTFEVRVLPSYLEADPIVAGAALFEAILRWCVETPASAAAVPASLKEMLASLPMASSEMSRWIGHM